MAEFVHSSIPGLSGSGCAIYAGGKEQEQNAEFINIKTQLENALSLIQPSTTPEVGGSVSTEGLSLLRQALLSWRALHLQNPSTPPKFIYLLTPSSTSALINILQPILTSLKFSLGVVTLRRTIYGRAKDDPRWDQGHNYKCRVLNHWDEDNRTAEQVKMGMKYRDYIEAATGLGLVRPGCGGDTANGMIVSEDMELRKEEIMPSGWVHDFGRYGLSQKQYCGESKEVKEVYERTALVFWHADDQNRIVTQTRRELSLL